MCTIKGTNQVDAPRCAVTMLPTALLWNFATFFLAVVLVCRRVVHQPHSSCALHQPCVRLFFVRSFITFHHHTTSPSSSPPSPSSTSSSSPFPLDTHTLRLPFFAPRHPNSQQDPLPLPERRYCPTTSSPPRLSSLIPFTAAPCFPPEPTSTFVFLLVPNLENVCRSRCWYVSSACCAFVTTPMLTVLLLQCPNNRDEA